MSMDASVRRLELYGFRIQITFDCRQMAQNVAEAELAWSVGPLNRICRNAGGHFDCTLAKTLVIVEEGLDAQDFHIAGRKFINWMLGISSAKVIRLIAPKSCARRKTEWSGMFKAQAIRMRLTPPWLTIATG